MPLGANAKSKILPPPAHSDIKATLAHWPRSARQQFDTIRDIVFTVAVRADVGLLIEALKWGQPAWLPERKRIGSTLRCAWGSSRPDQISLYLNCNTTLVETMRTIYPDAFEYEGRRGLHMPLAKELPLDAIDHCALLTLTYHRKGA